MKITEFEELTKFLYGEYEKMSEAYGAIKPSRILLKDTEKILLRYVKLYDKPLYRKAKRDLKLQEAIDTMPHGFWWKLFNSKLWKRMQYLEAQKKSNGSEKPKQEDIKPVETLPAEILRAVLPPRDLDV